MDYSIFNPVVWTIFMGMILILLVCIKLFHKKYPNFSEIDMTFELETSVLDVTVPTTDFSDKTVKVVDASNPVYTLYPLFLQSNRKFFYVKQDGELIGKVYLDAVLQLEELSESAFPKQVTKYEYYNQA